MENNNRSPYQVDVAIIGGGIAGLWLLNRLCNKGYNALLFEKRALGSDQTVASQGMIHGGVKYTLSGTLSGASEAIADMPGHWRACLRGEGDVDLRGARILSDHFYMWSTASVTSRLTGFFASKALRGRIDKVKNEDLPPLFQDPQFKGSLYHLQDMVMHVPSVISTLANNWRDRIYKIDGDSTRLELSSSHGTRLLLAANGTNIEVQATALVLTAGQGNAELLQACGASQPNMQRRPLQQVMVRHRLPHRFYGHCLGTDTTPRLTISSHPLQDGSQVWYLGGSLSEQGASQDSATVISHAQRELARLLPWCDLSDAHWATLRVDRAEPLQKNFARPDNAFAQWAECNGNVIAAWPTKLTLSPHLATEVEARLNERNITPSHSTTPNLPLPNAPISPSPWAAAFGVDDAIA